MFFHRATVAMQTYDKGSNSKEVTYMTQNPKTIDPLMNNIVSIARMVNVCPKGQRSFAHYIDVIARQVLEVITIEPIFLPSRMVTLQTSLNRVREHVEGQAAGKNYDDFRRLMDLSDEAFVAWSDAKPDLGDPIN